MNFFEPSFNSLLVLLATFTFVSVILRLSIARRFKKMGMTLVITRLLSVALLVLLFFQVLENMEEIKKERDPNESERQVLLLVDQSESMGFKDGQAESRSSLAENVYQNVDSVLKNNDSWKLSRLDFADRTASSETRQGLNTKESQLHTAFFHSLQRQKPDKLLILSDGAATDAAIAPHQIQWARNAGIEIYAIQTSASDANTVDVICHSAKSDTKNPEMVECQLRLLGSDGLSVKPQLLIDGKKVGEKEVFLQGNQKISFRLDPNLKAGWHEYEIRLEPLENEITAKNNSCRGAFLKTEVVKNLIAFVYDKARIENRAYRKIYQQQYDDVFEAFHYSAKELKELDGKRIKLLILADVLPAQLPRNLNIVFREKKACVFFISSPHLHEWQKELGVHVAPLKVLPQGSELSVVASKESGIAMSKGVATRRFHTFVAKKNYRTLLWGRAGDKKYPLLLSDKAQSPRRMLFLVDDTWRWSRNPNAAIQRSFAQIFEEVVRLSYPELDNDGPIQLRLKNRPDLKKAYFDAFVEENSPLAGLQELQLIGQDRDKLHKFKMKKVSPGKFRYVFNYRDETGLIWFMAQAQVQGKLEKSIRLPLVIVEDNKDMIHTLPREEHLRALAGSEANFALYKDREVLLDSLFEIDDIKAIKGRKNNRNHMFELAICLLLLLLWLVETYIERKSIQELG